MKIKNILAITALLGIGVSAQAITIDFLSSGYTANTALGNSATFSQGGATVTAYASGSESLFLKDEGVGEQGLGINSDPTGNNEIYGSTFIQLLSSTGAGGFAISSLTLNSVTDGEQAGVYYSTVLGILGTFLGSVSSNTTFDIASLYQDGYIGVAVYLGAETPNNVLLSTVTGNVPDGGTTVAMLGGALTALGLIRRKLSA